MKKLAFLILAISLSLAVVSGCGTDFFTEKARIDPEQLDLTVIDSNTDFAFDIFRELNREEPEKNIFISPLSISTALTMTLQGAAGTTREGMEEALNYAGKELSGINDTYRNLLPYLGGVDKDVELNIENSLWIREGEEIRQDFLETTESVFQAQTEELDFREKDASAKINRWVKEATRGKIEKILEDKIPDNVVMYLINAIYFKGQWTEQFPRENTFETEFQAGDGKQEPVFMMSKKGETEYGEGEDYQAVKLYYGNEKTAMYVILPREDLKLDTFIEHLDRDKWDRIKSSINTRKDVLVRLPRFTMEYGVKLLNDSLAKLGMEEAFTARADFSGIREGIFINRVLHKAVIEVNEEGSEAAAATVVEMTEAAAMEPLTFIADRPFLFVIGEEDTGTILFMGKLYSTVSGSDV